MTTNAQQLRQSREQSNQAAFNAAEPEHKNAFNAYVIANMEAGTQWLSFCEWYNEGRPSK